jgi:hypothetical protein
MASLSETAKFDSSDDSAPAPKGKKARGRQINLYDVVAGMLFFLHLIPSHYPTHLLIIDPPGRVTLNGPVQSPGGEDTIAKHPTSGTGLYTSRDERLAPEDVLFRRRHALVRYAENDIYWANENLPEGGRGLLPDSDLLKSVHAYASGLYEAMAHRLGRRCIVGSRTIDERSMDETALLAFGILLEEAAREALGKRGDLVFTEGLTDTKVATKVDESKNLSKADEDAAPRGRPSKRRRVAKGEDIG